MQSTNASESTQPEPQFSKPTVIVSGDGMGTYPSIRDALAQHLVKGNGEAVTLFVHDEHVVRLARRNRNDAVYLEELTANGLHDALTEVCVPCKITDSGPRPTAIPAKILSAVMTHLRVNLPPLTEVRHVPYLTPAGEVVEESGYRADTGIYLTQHIVPAVPARPTKAQVTSAVKAIKDSFGAFTYADDASRTNAMAMVMTTILRSAFPNDRVPLALVSATAMRAGKSLLCEAAGMVANGGESVAVNNWPESDAEFRKRIMPQLEAGNGFIHLDNVSDVGVQSPTFAAILTADRYSDRILTTCRVPEVAIRTTFVATGINLRVSSELTRRAYLIDLEPFEAGHSFTYPNLATHVRENWPVIVWAVLTMARAWTQAGSPGPTADAGAHDFAEWRRVIGGILGMVGFPAFLANGPTLSARVDILTPEWTEFLMELRNRFQTATPTTVQILDALVPGDVLDDAVPDDLARVLKTAREAGKCLARWADKPLGGLMLRRAGHVGGGNVKWEVIILGATKPRASRAKAKDAPELPVAEGVDNPE